MVQFSKNVIVETIIFGGENCTKNLNPTRRCVTMKSDFRGLLAQRLEQGTHNPLVAGSNPAGPTIFVVNNRTFEFSLTAVKANRKIEYSDTIFSATFINIVPIPLFLYFPRTPKSTISE